MFYVRETPTTSSSRAIQVIRYDNRKTIVVKHIGSAKTKEDILLLKEKAREYIQTISRQISLFNEFQKNPADKIIQIGNCEYLGVKYSFIYKIIWQIFELFKFSEIDNKLLLDLVLIRIIEPSSKLHSLELLEELFGIKYGITEAYRLMELSFPFKETIERKTIEFAKKNFNFNFSLVFYDVTTLYFEAFEEDTLRKCGFSKDGKSNQPQILIGLIVDEKGFPLSFEVFAGNKFEGHTLLPAILDFKNKYQIPNLTVVADAAMISKENIIDLYKHDLSYIVGARLGNLKINLQEKIAKKLKRRNKTAMRIKTENGLLICDFSRKRYQKDRYEMDKQIKKAKALLSNPEKITKRNKFLKLSGREKMTVNKELIKKTKKLLGIKGYYTNLVNLKNKTIINQYHNLWEVEKSFRISKNDLKMRPIYHHKAQAIKTHILICFMALAVCKFIELRTKISIARIIKLLKSITEARILDKVNNEEFTLQTKVSDEIKNVLRNIGVSY